MLSRLGDRQVAKYSTGGWRKSKLLFFIRGWSEAVFLVAAMAAMIPTTERTELTRVSP
jgi:hypothetical protein